MNVYGNLKVIKYYNYFLEDIKEAMKALEEEYSKLY